MSIEEIKQALDQQFPGAVIRLDEQATPKALYLVPEQLLACCEWLYSYEKTYFDMLSCVTGIDNGPEVNTMEVAYNLCSIPFEQQLMLKVELPRDNPTVPSVQHIWKTANWHERETFDLLGIQFENHPDLRRILLPADWEGHPLKKDYEHQETYRGIKVDY